MIVFMLVCLSLNAKAEYYGSQVLEDAAAGISQKIKNIADLELSCSADSDCLAIESGSRACGGPERFVMTSSKNISLDVLKQLITAETALESHLNTVGEIMSICSMESPPQLECKQSLCSVK